MNLSKDKAQAVTELAVFGAILLFVIGGIIRVSVQAGMDQNQSLKAMRWALLQSLYGVYDENKSRDSASVLLIEDRLDPRADKFGSLERVPLIASAAGTMSNTIFMPLDWNEHHNIPVTDVFVNGQHFVFTTARFIVYDIQRVTSAAISEEASHVGDVRVWDLTNDIKTYLPDDGNWDFNCRLRTYSTAAASCNITNVTEDLGCPLFYRIVPKNGKRYCNNDACLDGILSLDQRFDLNRNGIFTDDPDGVDRSNIMWQWWANKAIKNGAGMKINRENGVYLSYDMDGDRKEEMIYAINETSLNHLDWANNNLKDLNVINGLLAIKKGGIAQRISVLDFQKGDLDLTIDDLDKTGPNAAAVKNIGLQTEASVYTLTKEGTYLEIKEGKAYVPGTDTFVRSVSKKDSFDLISRTFQLSNDTGRYCKGVGNGRTPQGPVVEPIGGAAKGDVNPVKYCVNSKPKCRPGANPSDPQICEATGGTCYTSVTSSQTCFDIGTKKLFIRSRIEDTRGHKWFTQTK